jgi:hypothetical protein
MKYLRSSLDLLDMIKPEIWDNYKDEKGNINIIQFIKESDWSLYPNLNLSKLTNIFEHLAHNIKTNTVATASLIKAVDNCTIKK